MRDDRYKRHYSETGFAAKLLEISGTLKEYAIILYLLLHDPDTPAWAKIAIIAALGYLIFPYDAVPDMVPFVGYSDDLAVLTALILNLDRYITPEMWRKAEGHP